MKKQREGKGREGKGREGKERKEGRQGCSSRLVVPNILSGMQPDSTFYEEQGLLALARFSDAAAIDEFEHISLQEQEQEQEQGQEQAQEQEQEQAQLEESSRKVYA
jgi:hypothetical protein